MSTVAEVSNQLFGSAISAGLLVGALIALVNSWRT